ncbi:MAG TPA: DUF4397 domain-containing protein [bacterium]|nr:DUF4397 domain-containing protein [bacterium]
MKINLTNKSVLMTLLLVFALASSLTLVACGDDDDDDDNDDLADDDDDIADDDDDDDAIDDDDDTGDDDDDTIEEADIRALHLSPDAGVVDIYVDNSLLFVEGLDFTEGTTYGTVAAGDYVLNILPTGGDPATDSVFDIPVTLEAARDYSAVVYGGLPVKGSGLSAFLIVDDTTDLAAGSFRLFVGHTADGVGEVDIWNIPEMGDPTLILEDVDYGDYAFLDLPAAAYTLGFDSDNDELPNYIFEIPELAADAQYNVFAVLDGMDLFLIAQLPDGSTVQIDPSPIF